jgi:rhodanese-related sulfurtransferase
MKRLMIALMLAAAAAGLPVAAQTIDLTSPTLRIQWEEFRKAYDAKTAVVVDVRDEASFEAGHIPGARSIPLDQIATRAAELKKLNKPILLYCA